MTSTIGDSEGLQESKIKGVGVGGKTGGTKQNQKGKEKERKSFLPLTHLISHWQTLNCIH